MEDKPCKVRPPRARRVPRWPAHTPTPGGIAMDEKLSLKYQLISAWCGPAFLITFVLFWGVIGQNLPNPSPDLSATDLATRYLIHLNDIRLGFIVSLIIIVLYMPWSALLAAQMARIEGKFPVM